MAAPATNPVIENLNMRQVLLNTASPMAYNLGTYTESSAPEGKTTRIKLQNTGILTKLGLVVTANVTIGTATATLSPKAPWNVIKQIKMTDFQGTDRVNCSGLQLWALNSVRKKYPAYLNNGDLADVSSMPDVPTAVGTANIKFYVEVPFAFSEVDLRGAILAQTGAGEQYLTITWNEDFHQNGNDNGVYNGAGTSTVAVNSISVQVVQHYLMPQQISGQTPYPMLDLLTVYEINGNRLIADNLTNGQERLLDYPNNRSILGVYANYMNNSVMSNAIGQFRTIVNGNNVLTDLTNDHQLMMQRGWLSGADLKTGVFFFLHRGRVIETAQYGNVQVGLTPNAATTSPTLELMFESMYAKGATLQGINNQ